MKFFLTSFSLIAMHVAIALPDLEILDGDYPISFFFRQSEADASLGRMSYEDWESGYSRMNGVMGKMLDEEIVGRSKGQDYFRRFKADHPRQAVLLHVNGGFRKPVADISEYHDGHWLYYNGAKVMNPISGRDKTITIKVSDVSVFLLHPYRSNPDLPDDVGLCLLDAKGRPDWNHAEQTMLVSIDENASTITLERSVYGDKGRHEYAAGKAYVASHVAQNWGTTNKLWEFNMSTECPRDGNGNQASDVWANQLIEAMRPGGEIDFIDGFQFDVPFIQPISLGRNRKPDSDADGKPDFGIVDGKPVFTNGMEKFFRILKESLPDKLIMADSGGKSQRSLKYLNGMETEGFPELKDTEFHYWSTSINYHQFWATRSAKPRFHYGLMKYLRWTTDPEISDSRLIMAGTTLHGAAVPIGRLPVEPTQFVYDEILGGELQKKGWLGKPVEEVRRLALEQPSIAGGKWNDGNADVRKKGDGISISKKGKKQLNLQFGLDGIRHDHRSDLVIKILVSCETRSGYPEGYYRELTMEMDSSGDLPTHVKETSYVSPVGEDPFQIVFYIREVPAGKLSLKFLVEGAEPLEIHHVSIHETADLTVREFEHGLVLANPSDRAQTFDLEKLYPGKPFRRLKATKGQDKKVNNGKAITAPVVVPALDALFLLKE